MDKKAANIYRNPADKSKLNLETCDKKGEILSGIFRNKEGSLSFYIKNGIPDFTYPKQLAKIDEETKNSYENLANEYEKFADIPFKTFKTNEKKIREKITDKLNIKEKSVVLEIGAGDGRGAEHIVKRLGKKGKLFIQELSPAFLNKAVKRLKRYQQKTTIECSIANAMYLPFADDTFDAVHHFGGFNTFSDQKLFFQEVVRVVKTGGKVVIGDESMAPWLRETKMGKIMMNSNPLLQYEIPFEIIPIKAREVNVEWIMMGAFFILEFAVAEGEPQPNYHIPIPSKRGGTHWTRYYGQLEGISDKTKKIAYKAQQRSGKSMSQWLDDVVKKASKEQLESNNNEI
jgi:ubiquinone/menaquinone biosynthesis C-methylase UbiE